MIFIAGSIIIFLISAWLLAGGWVNIWSRILFGVFSLIASAVLFLFGLNISISAPRLEAERRIVLCAVDVSASTGLTLDEAKKTISGEYSDYNLEIIPFSDSLRGREKADSTAMIDSLRAFMSYAAHEYLDERIAGTVIITDGNETEDVSSLTGEPKTIGSFPHNVVYLKNKNDDGDFDKSVVFLDAPRFMTLFNKERVTFAVYVSGGRLDGVPVELRLDGKVLGNVYVPVKGGYGEGFFDLIIKDPGNYLLEAAVARDARERFLENNRDYASIEGIMKGFRVLHISGHPSADTAFVRRGLQNIPGVDMISFYILRTMRQLASTPENELSLIPFPTDELFRKELDNFDLIIINDFFLSEFLNPLYINNIVGFVKSGGGLLIFGGPNSYLAKDCASNSFCSLLPFVSSQGPNWQGDIWYGVTPDAAGRLTSIGGLWRNARISFSGINRLGVRESALVFARSEDGGPVIAGGYHGKGRVLAVATDSFWRSSYNGSVNNERALKSMVRYLLGISTMPVKITGSTVAFNMPAGGAAAGVTAVLTFKNPDGTTQHEETITPDAPYKIRKDDSRLLSVKIMHGGKPLDEFKLVNIQEKHDNEFAFIQNGKPYLKKLSDKSGGVFIESGLTSLEKKLGKSKLRDAVALSEKKLIQAPLWQHAGLLLLLLYSALAAFYFKSRYHD